MGRRCPRCRVVGTGCGCFVVVFQLDLASGIMSASKKPLRLLLIGKTGTGKSSTGNSILREMIFDSELSTTSVTKKSLVFQGTIADRPVVVTDTPGLADIGLTTLDSFKAVYSEIARAVAANPDGFDAVLYTLVLGRQSKEDKDVSEQIKAMLSDSVFQKKGILVFTHGDDYDPEENDGKTAEDWCKDQDGPLRELMQECGNRYLIIDNETDDKNKKDSQLTELMDLVDDLLSKNPEPLTPGVFKLAQDSRDKMQEKMAEEDSVQESEENLKVITTKIQGISGLNPEQDLKELQRLKEDLQFQHGKIRGQFKYKGDIPSTLARTIDMAQKWISDKVQCIENNQKSEKELKEKIKTISDSTDETKKQLEQAKKDHKKALDDMDRKHKKEMDERKQIYEKMVATRRQSQADKTYDNMSKTSMFMGLVSKAFDMYINYKCRQTNITINHPTLNYSQTTASHFLHSTNNSNTLAYIQALVGTGTNSNAVNDKATGEEK